MDATLHNFGKSNATIDLKHGDRERYIACCALDCKRQVALVDPGPSSTLTQLRHDLRERGIAISDIGAIFLTHIHFDHAGATGSLVRKNPRIQVYVHERGAVHLADPKRLLASASRVFGTNIEEYWGPFHPVPGTNLRVLTGGEEIIFGARQFEVVYTPGHAVHHVSYFDHENRVAFVGDAAGIRIADLFVYPATPPPDVDLDDMYQSLDLIEKRKPHGLYLTHFGLVDRVEWHMAEFRARLHRWSEYVRLALEQNQDDPHRARDFAEMVKAELSLHASKEEAAWFEKSFSFQHNWSGLAHYWRKQKIRRNPTQAASQS